ncbi:sporulation protein YpjB [Cohnella fermenti]|uniref:Sporulation protein n=1 Tax=Cohnella fermenti TaxID=2565925 RepID=A0A4S4BUX8_9BACL|nr:sporulation protein YpjB [Cohnella fermenti]THF78395.1 hypothetical protein E6C55_14390 [Cohnella fermenti]
MRRKSASKGRLWRGASSLAAALALLFAGLPFVSGVGQLGGGQYRHAAAEEESRTDISNEPSVLAFYSAAESLYEAVRKGDRLAGTQALQEVERGLRRLPMDRIPTAEGIASLAANVSEMKRAWAAVSPDTGRIEQAAGALRLAADALAHPSRPLWHQYQTVLEQDAAALAKAIAAADSPKAALEAVATHYRLIRTAASLQAEPAAIERADSVLRYAERLIASASPSKERLAALGQEVRDAVAGLFPQAEGSPANVLPLAPPTWGLTATIGSFIITILSWAGWRRFRFDRDHPGRRSEASRNRTDAANRWFR